LRGLERKGFEMRGFNLERKGLEMKDEAGAAL
jgi:hypothetical protein